MIGGRWPYVGLVRVEQIVIFAGSMNLFLKDIKHVVDNGTIRFQKKCYMRWEKVLKCCC